MAFKVVHLKDRKMVTARPIARKYRLHGYEYGFVVIDGREVEVCQSCTVTLADGTVRKEWEEVTK